jgi:glycogen operon protein
MRRFIRGQQGMVKSVMERLTGSHDLYVQNDRQPARSINFITCHDGFTLNDLCAYERKHNEDNGEQNRDGSDVNDSCNYGIEGPSADPAIESLRLRQIKNLLTILLLSQGTPMLLMGDEVRRTQRGNNNAYCQDNELSFFNWHAIHEHAELLRFVRGVIHLKQSHQLFQMDRFWTEPGGPELTWHGVQPGAPDLRHDSHSIALEIVQSSHGEHLYMILNSYWEPLTFKLPTLPSGQRFYCLVDTGQPSPQDYFEVEQAPPCVESTYLAAARSVVVLKAR